YASAVLLSIESAVPPCAFVYAAAKSALPAAVEPGNQSPEDMMPVVLALPTLSGNSTGELAPLDRNMNWGLNFSWTRLLTCPYASSLWVPPTSMSGLTATTFAMIGE